MKKFWKTLGIIVLLIAVLLLVVPLLVPYIPPGDVQPRETFFSDDSNVVEINGIEIHYKESGDPNGPLVLLLHGFGASTFSWHRVMEQLSVYGHVVAYDRPAFGLTERPMPEDEQGWEEGIYGEDANIAIIIGLMDHFGAEQAILIGNSAGGRVAMAAAVAFPERVRALVLVDSVGGEGASQGLLGVVLRSPQLRAIGPYLARTIASSGEDTIQQAWHDPSLITEEIIAGYKLPLQVENWDRALWEFTRASKRPDLVSRFDRLTMPVLVVSGDDDRIVPVETAVRLAEQINGASLVIFDNCGHVPHEECPQAFMDAIDAFLPSIP
jgi:pimeloyl-ACP methyl ester carboxylesterase